MRLTPYGAALNGRLARASSPLKSGFARNPEGPAGPQRARVSRLSANASARMHWPDRNEAWKA